MKKQRKLVIGFLLVLAVLVSGITFAYWANGIDVTQAVDETDTIQIGSGDTVTTTVLVNGGTANTLPLVPVGREVEDESVSSITYTFAVEWAGTEDASATGATADLTVTPTLSGLGVTELGLFTVTAETTQNVVYGSITNITIIVEFTNEPLDVAQYNLVANQELTLTVAFNLGTVTPA